MNGMYTLAENGTTKTGQKQILVFGKGSDLRNKDALKGRAKRKTITQSVALNLADVAKEVGDLEMKKTYWNTYYCQNSVISSEGKLFGTYCKNRFCTVCSSIRKAEIINRYLPQIELWEDPHFVTLTILACEASKLKGRIDALIRGLKRITQKYRKRHQRGTDIKLIGVRSIECNFNPKRNTYNPHIHIIAANKRMAEILITEWLKLWTHNFTHRKAQHVRKVYNVETNLIEIIKYGTKIFTESELNKHTKEESNYQIFTAALNTILIAMKGRRIFERFGFNLRKSTEKNDPSPKILNNFKEWEYNPQVADWQNTSSSEVLSGYTLPPKLQTMLSENIDIKLK